MKNLFKTLILAGVVAAATTSGAFAGGNPQLMAQRNWEYFNQQKKLNPAKQVVCSRYQIPWQRQKLRNIPAVTASMTSS